MSNKALRVEYGAPDPDSGWLKQENDRRKAITQPVTIGALCHELKSLTTEVNKLDERLAWLNKRRNELVDRITMYDDGGGQGEVRGE